MFCFRNFAEAAPNEEGSPMDLFSRIVPDFHSLALLLTEFSEISLVVSPAEELYSIVALNIDLRYNHDKQNTKTNSPKSF